jgi:hypothetical protein
MQWLYDLIHGVFEIMFNWFGKIWWLVKNSVTFQIAVITSVVTVGVTLWRMFYYGVTKITSSLSEMETALSSISSVDTVSDILDLANFLFPVEEALAMFTILISYGVTCLTIRVIRSFIPTMT